MSDRRYQLWLRLIFESRGHIFAMGRATCGYVIIDTHNAEQCERFAEELQTYGYWLQAEGPAPSVQALIGCRNGVPKWQKTREKGTI